MKSNMAMRSPPSAGQQPTNTTGPLQWSRQAGCQTSTDPRKTQKDSRSWTSPCLGLAPSPPPVLPTVAVEPGPTLEPAFPAGGGPTTHACCLLFRSVFPTSYDRSGGWNVRPRDGRGGVSGGREGVVVVGAVETALWSGQKLSVPGGGGNPEQRRRDSWPPLRGGEGGRRRNLVLPGDPAAMRQRCSPQKYLQRIL